MGALGMILDALGVAASTVGGVSPTCSPQFALEEARTGGTLRKALAAHADAVSSDEQLLAHARLAASRLLREEALRAASHVHLAERVVRERAKALLGTRHRAWTTLGAAEQVQERANALRSAANAIGAFVALHDATIRSIRQALAQTVAPELPMLIVAACRQATALITAVRVESAAALGDFVGEAVRAAAADMPSSQDWRERRATSHGDAAAPLGQFLRMSQNDGPSTPPAQPRMSQADVRMTLESIRAELADGRYLVGRVHAAIRERPAGLGSALRRAPIWYAELAVGGVVATHALATRSRYLGGNGELEGALLQSAALARAFVVNNVVTPTTRFYTQVFRSAPPTGASAESVAVQRKALREMILNYTADHLADVPEAKELAMKGDTSAVMDDYVRFVRQPARNLISGNLTEAILVQVQKLKTDVEELLVNAKSQLRAQEVNLALVALVPAIATLAFTAYVISEVARRMRRGRARTIVVSPEQALAFMLGDVHKALVTLKHPEDDDPYRSLVRVGRLAIAVHETRTFVEDGGVRAPRKVLDSFVEQLASLEDESSVDAAILHVHRVWAIFPSILPSGSNAIAALL